MPMRGVRAPCARRRMRARRRAARFALAHEIFYFHLLEFAGAKNKIARRYLVAKRLPYLGDPEWQFGMERIDDVLEIDENPSCGLRPQVCSRRLLACANGSLKHRIEH